MDPTLLRLDAGRVFRLNGGGLCLYVEGDVTFCEAIARQEGWLQRTSRCRRNHNPGNIRYGRFAASHGATGSDGAFAIFPDDQTGFEAMSALLEAAYTGLTVAQAIAKWAPPTENNTAQYIADVAEWTGLSSDTELTSELLAAPKLETA